MLIMIAMGMMIIVIAMIIMSRHCQIDDLGEVRGQIVCQGLSWGQPGGHLHDFSAYGGNFRRNKSNNKMSTF